MRKQYQVPTKQYIKAAHCFKRHYLNPAIWQKYPVLPLSRVFSLLLTVRVVIARVGVNNRVAKTVGLWNLENVDDVLISCTKVDNTYMVFILIRVIIMTMCWRIN